MNVAIVKSPVSGHDHLSTIAALTVILDLIMRKMSEIRSIDARAHHAAAQGNIRSALDYERKVLAELMDPKGMSAITSDAMREIRHLSSSEAILLMETINHPQETS